MIRKVRKFTRRASLFNISYVEESALGLCSNICGQYNYDFIVLGTCMTFCLTTRTLSKKPRVSLACRLPVDKKWRGDQSFTRNDFLATSFSLPTLSTFEYSSGYLLFISYSTMIENGRINTRKLIGEKLHHRQRPKTWWTWRVIINENKPRAYHKNHLHTIKVYNTGPVYSLIKEIFT